MPAGRGLSTIDPAPTLSDVRALLAAKGPVARALGGYEDRPQQVRMAVSVEEALRGKRHLIVEAGTGVGKSFAYLVPALAWAHEHRAKVAVATSTIALQEQLAGKDLPLLAKALPFDVSFALVKGRGNYLCLRRMHAAIGGQGDLFPADDPRTELMAVAAAAANGAGSRQDLPFSPREDVWDAVKAESGNCLHRACPFYEGCAYQKGRRTAQKATLLVMNHHLLLADLALRRDGASFLPAVDAVIVDEAHDLEDAASDTLGQRVTSRGSQQILSRLWNERRGIGLLARHPDVSLRVLVEDTRRASREFFDEVREALRAREAAGTTAFEGPVEVSDAFPAGLSALALSIAAALPAAESRDVAMELAVRGNAVENLAEAARAVVAGPDEEHACWAEWDARGNGSLVRAPIDVGPSLREALYGAYGTVVLTSATLSTGRPASFAYTRERLGLEDAEELTVGSPFDFARQAKIVIRTDLPDPARDGAAFESALPEAVLAAVRRTKGGAFVLFTSYESMRRVADATRGRFEGDGLTVLVHGEELQRTAMLERFRETNAVLFGVSSFWQGVDVPGDALRNVVIARLPFDVPTHPLQKAREARLARAGRSAFSELSLPGAALRLKQGFGRLIRRATDTGIVVILDPRIVTKRYGKALLDSLPECPIELEPPLPE